MGWRHRAAHPLQYQDPCAQTEKGTSQLALPGRQVHKASAANMSCGRASRSRPHHNPPGHPPRGTTRVVSPAWGLRRAVASGSVAGSILGTGAVVPRGRSPGLPVGFLVRKQVSLEHGSVRCPEAGEVPHSNLFCLFGAFGQVTSHMGDKGPRAPSGHSADAARVLTLQRLLPLDLFGNASFNSYQVQFSVKLAGS